MKLTFLQEPIVPLSLEKAKAAGKRFTAKLEALKSDPKLMPRFKDTDTIKTPKEKVQDVEKPGHVTVKVIDVGGKFLDVNERLHRISRSARRARQKASRAAQQSWGPGRLLHSYYHRNICQLVAISVILIPWVWFIRLLDLNVDIDIIGALPW